MKKLFIAAEAKYPNSLEHLKSFMGDLKGKRIAFTNFISEKLMNQWISFWLII
jgi:hypothetical protein